MANFDQYNYLHTMESRSSALQLILPEPTFLSQSNAEDHENCDEIIDEPIYQFGGGSVLKEYILLLQEAAKKGASICGGKLDIYCIITLAAKDSEKQALRSIYSPSLMSALQRSNWGSSIACSIISAAVLVVCKLSVTNNNDALIKNSKTPPQRNCTDYNCLHG